MHRVDDPPMRIVTAACSSINSTKHKSLLIDGADRCLTHTILLLHGRCLTALREHFQSMEHQSLHGQDPALKIFIVAVQGDVAIVICAAFCIHEKRLLCIKEDCTSMCAWEVKC